MSAFLQALYREFLLCEEDREAIHTHVATIPNAITGLGIVLTVLYCVQITTGVLAYLAPVVVVLIGTSDLFDGLAARRLNAHTWSGKWLDSLRDKLLRVAAGVDVIINSDALAMAIAALVLISISECTLLCSDTKHYCLKRQYIFQKPLSRFLQVPSLSAIGLIAMCLHWFMLPSLATPLLWVVALASLGSLLLHQPNASSA